VKNIPNIVNTSFANVHLVALCYSPDLKTYGFAAVLIKFVEEMKRLSTEGFTGDFPRLGTRKIYVSLLQVACDNLALNSLLGFIECFSTDYFCTMCYASQADIQVKFFESDFQLRTVSEHNIDIATMSVGNTGRVHSRGVKSDCILNQLPGFHVTRNFSLDIMHIALEGIVSFELSCILFHLCNVSRYIPISAISKRINRMWSVMNVDRCNKPLELNALDEPGRLYPYMKAVQIWALLRYLPLAIGDVVPHNDKHWLLLLHLSELVDMIFLPVFTPGMVNYLRDFIADHLHMFVDLYGNVDGVKLKPKHHLLVHLPSVILASGTLVGMSCMRYELKNSFFKRCAHIVCNFSNVCLTLAYRH